MANLQFLLNFSRKKLSTAPKYLRMTKNLKKLEKIHKNAFNR